MGAHIREGGRPSLPAASWVTVADLVAVLVSGAWLGLEIGIWLVLGSGW